MTTMEKNITFQQYQAAKKIVDDYEEYLRHEEMLENDDDERDWDEEDEENEDQERFERACACTCGAWQIDKNGNAIHVADCYCGAD